jgi:hypothetical protein
VRILKDLSTTGYIYVLSLLLLEGTELLEGPGSTPREDGPALVYASVPSRIWEPCWDRSPEDLEFVGVRGGSRPLRLWLKFSYSSWLSGALRLRRSLLATKSG